MLVVVVKVLLIGEFLLQQPELIYSAVDFCSANCYPKVYDDVVD